MMDNLLLQWFESLLSVMDTLGIAGVSIGGLVLVTVAFLRQFDTKDGEQWLKGNKSLIVGFAIGFVFSIIAYIATNRPPIDTDWYIHFVYWVVGLMYGILFGILPSGTYELVFKKDQ
jgi:hypothetical protein